MDLGATVCTPRRPRCELCPLARDCRGRARGRAEAYPRPRRRPPPARARQVAALTRREDGSLLLVRRGDAEALLAGLWEPPTVTARGRRAAEAALARTYGGRWRLGAPQVRVRHGITTRAIVLEARPAEWTPGDATALAEGPEGRWWTPEQARALALTGLARKVLERWPAGD
jgi:A/G-specific adenine glycosylase